MKRYTSFIGILAFSLIVLGGCQFFQQTQQPQQTQQQQEQKQDSAAVIGDLRVEEPMEDMRGEWVTYGDDFRGYLVKPEAAGTYPGVVMIHEWWGLNQNIMNMAQDLSDEGYNVVAVDLYDGRVAEESADAGAYATEVRESPARAIEHMKAAAAYLREQSDSSGQVASMGWCFGGQQSLQLALNDELDATVIYYGSLETDEETLSSIDWPVLGVFGEEDGSIPVETVNEFDAALDSLGVENEIYIYEGVGHAFANPSNDGHDPEKTADAWDKTVDFLGRHLQ